MTIRALVITTRLRLGMTQEELGEKIGYSATLISDVERGRRVPTLDFIGALAKVAARETVPPDRTPPDGLLRAACAQCPVGQACDEITFAAEERAA